MRYLCPVLIGRSARSLDRPFSYYVETEDRPSALVRVLIDFGHTKDCVGFIASEPTPLDESPEEYFARTGVKLSPIKQILDRAPIITPALDELAHAMANRYLCPLIAIYQAMLPPSLKPSDSSLGKPKEKIVRMVRALPRDEQPLLSREQKLYDRIAACGPEGMKLTAALEGTATFLTLKNRNLLEIFQQRVNRIKEVETINLDYQLNPDQTKAVDYILNTDKLTTLLQGVTGSGKTLVYMELAQRMLERGRGSIILVPEIALTDRIASLFKGRFKDRVSILHSSLRAANKYDEYLRIKSGETSVVVGTRSAVFAPVKDLGLICLDEEQSSTYKQDTTPYYDARVVAQMRAAAEGAKVVLGSATPLVEDKTRAMRGYMSYTQIARKYSDTPEVTAELVDMSDMNNLLEGTRLISKPLLEALKSCLEKKEQAILFINRRGYAPLIQCRKCQKTMECPTCLIPLTLHTSRQVLFCHRCGARYPYVGYRCPKCDCDRFFTLGYGTERVVEDLGKLLPEARIERLDLDSENQRERILHRFRDGDFDILVGTQMVAKGHDFPRVTLAAALAADQSLAIPSYLSSERTFELVSQLVGRSGRADRPGRAIIQTYNPTNSVLLHASRQDYEGFYAQEVEDRRNFIYPPFCFMCDILIGGADLKKVTTAAYGVKSLLAAKLAGKPVNIYGPLEVYRGIVNGKRYRKIALKYKDSSLVAPVLKTIPSTFTDSELSITIDIDSRGD